MRTVGVGQVQHNSPSVVYDPTDTNSFELTEIKCPYSFRNQTHLKQQSLETSIVRLIIPYGNLPWNSKIHICTSAKFKNRWQLQNAHGVTLWFTPSGYQRWTNSIWSRNLDEWATSKTSYILRFLPRPRNSLPCTCAWHSCEKYTRMTSKWVILINTKIL